MAASITLVFGGKEQESYILDKPVVVVGRDEGSGIRIDNLGISRAHCQFLKRGTAWLLQDMNSSNGTFVNGRKVGEHYLNDNDEVVLGKYSLVFHADTAPGAGAKPASAVSASASASPSAGPVGPGGGPPDVLHTYVMDGQKIREQVKLAKEAQQPAQPAADDPLRPRGTPIRPRAAAPKGGVKTWMYFLVAANILLVLFLVAIVLILVFGRGAGGPPAP